MVGIVVVRDQFPAPSVVVLPKLADGHSNVAQCIHTVRRVFAGAPLPLKVTVPPMQTAPEGETLNPPMVV